MSANVAHFKIQTSEFLDGYTITCLRQRKMQFGVGLRFLAGCRNFTLSRAKTHWKDRSDRRNIYKFVLRQEQFARDRGYRLHDRKK